MNQLPKSWSWVSIVELLDKNSNGKPFQQGWSPQCHNHPASENCWGVLKTTAIQDGEFWGHENKQLPESIEPRPHLEIAKGDILMTCAGPRNRCGVVCFVKETRPKLLMSGKMYRFRPNSTLLDSKYLEGFIRSHQAQRTIDSMKTGISDSGLNLTHGRFSELMVPFAPLPEQKRIVAKIEELFSELDNGIAALKTAREQLKVYRQAVLKHAFEGKLTAKWREENADKLESPEQLLARIQQEREARYQQQLDEWKAAIKAWEVNGKEGKKPGKPTLPKDSELNTDLAPTILWELPLSWQWIKLSELLQNSPQNGLYKPASDYGSGCQIIRIDNFYDGSIVNAEKLKRLSVSDDEIATYGLQAGNLIVNRVNSIEYLGKSALVRQLNEPTVFESNIMRCSLIARLVSNEYVTLYLNSTSGRKELCKNAKHAVNQASINQTDVGNTFVPLCTMEEQVLIAQEISGRFDIVDRTLTDIDLQLHKAETLRQSILQKAFSGQLVPQDANDEPAVELLARIQARREDTKTKSTNKTRKAK